MSKRGENIYHRRDGRWEGRYIKSRKPNGAACFGSVYGSSYNEVKQKLIPLKIIHHESYMEFKSTQPFSDYLEAQLERQRNSRIKPATFDIYYRIVHNHILPHLGKYPMHHLTTQIVQQFLLRLRQDGLSDSSIRQIFRYLSSAIRQAAKSGCLLTDVCDGIILPKARAKTIHALSRSEQQRLEAAAMEMLEERRDCSGLEVILALYTGMRVGEICALRWEDIDFANQMIHVNHTLQRLSSHDHTAKTVIRLGTPKSESSIRQIPIGAQLVQLLTELRRNSQSEFVLSGRSQFTEPRLLQYRFEHLLQRAGLPRMGFHTLRHSFATRCMELNIDAATISKLLGHSSIKMTLDIYTDSLMEHRRAAITKLHNQAIQPVAAEEPALPEIPPPQA